MQDPPRQRKRPHCGVCAGERYIPCPECEATGRLKVGGYFHHRNTFDARRVVGSQWTALAPTFGWRHFQAVATKKLGSGKKKQTLVCLEATCDTSVQFWIPIRNLRDRGEWASGWLQRTEMTAVLAQVAAAKQDRLQGQSRADTAAPIAQLCQRCQGEGRYMCTACAGSGEGPEGEIISI